MSQPKTRRCTGPFNWGGAHCAGEKVKRRTGPFLQKSHSNKQNKTGTARHGNQEPPGQAPRCTGQEATTKHKKRLRPQIQVRLNVHRSVHKHARIRYCTLTRSTLQVNVHNESTKATASYCEAEGPDELKQAPK